MKKQNYILKVVITILLMVSVASICHGQTTTSKHRNLINKDRISQQFLEFMSDTDYIRILQVADNTDNEISKSLADSISERTLCQMLKAHLDSLYTYHLRTGQIEPSVINNYKYDLLSEIYINEAVKQSNVNSLTKKTKENIYKTYMLIELYTPEIFHAWDKQFLNQMDTLLLRKNFTYEVFMEIFHEEFRKIENSRNVTIKETYTYEDFFNKFIEELEKYSSKKSDKKKIEEIRIKFHEDLEKKQKEEQKAFYEEFKKALIEKFEQDSIEQVRYEELKQYIKNYFEDTENLEKAK